MQSTTQGDIAPNIYQYIHWFSLKFRDSMLEDRFMEQRLQPFQFYRYTKFAVIMYLGLCSVRCCMTILAMFFHLENEKPEDNGGLISIISFFVVTALEVLIANIRILRWLKGTLWITYAYMLISYSNSILYPKCPGCVPMYS
jgi:hypothetical protein